MLDQNGIAKKVIDSSKRGRSGIGDGLLHQHPQQQQEDNLFHTQQMSNDYAHLVQNTEEVEALCGDPDETDNIQDIDFEEAAQDQFAILNDDDGDELNLDDDMDEASGSLLPDDEDEDSGDQEQQPVPVHCQMISKIPHQIHSQNQSSVISNPQLRHTKINDSSVASLENVAQMLRKQANSKPKPSSSQTHLQLAAAAASTNNRKGSRNRKSSNSSKDRQFNFLKQKL